MMRERGLVLVIFALFAAIFLILAGLAIGLGMVAYSKSEAQIVANAAALAAIEGWVGESNSSSKANTALAHANAILEKNKISALRDPALGIGRLYFPGSNPPSDSAGVLRLARYIPRNISGSNDSTQCNGVFPCVIYYNGSPAAGAVVNSAQVLLTTGSYNPVLGPFIPEWMGSSLFQLQVKATSTFVERCTAFLMDLSMSIAYETHQIDPGYFGAPNPSPPPGYPYPAKVIKDPLIPAMFAMRNSSMAGPPAVDCSVASSILRSNDTTGNRERLAYCSLRTSRLLAPSSYPWDGTWPLSPASPLPTPVPPSNPNYSLYHYKDDYELVQYGRWGPALIDKYNDDYYKGPQPFRTILDAYNLALRTLSRQQTSMDLATIKVFTGQKVDEIPPALQQSGSYPPLTNDLGYMTQITNYMNIRPFDRTTAGGQKHYLSNELTPNFISHGWYPLQPNSGDPLAGPAGGTNIVTILDQTIDDMANGCARNAKKQIILATDGISTCSYVTHSDATHRYPDDAGPYNCEATFDVYSNSELQLLAGSGDPFSDISNPPYPGIDGVASYTYPSIIQRLREQEIAVTVLLIGDYVKPNFMNVRDWTPPSPNPFAPGDYPMDYLEALGLGFTGFANGLTIPTDGAPVSADFFNTAPSCPAGVTCDDRVAYDHAGKAPGYVFRRPNGVLGRLAIQTGGLWCPLAPRDIPANYSGGIHMNRPIGTAEEFSYLDMSKSEMAAQCASQAVGYNPYILADPLRELSN